MTIKAMQISCDPSLSVKNTVLVADNEIQMKLLPCFTEKMKTFSGDQEQQQQQQNLLFFLKRKKKKKNCLLVFSQF